jgi:hypothetical protein
MQFSFRICSVINVFLNAGTNFNDYYEQLKLRATFLLALYMKIVLCFSPRPAAVLLQKLIPVFFTSTVFHLFLNTPHVGVLYRNHISY